MKTLLLKSEKSILLIMLLIVTSISRGQTQTYSTPGSSNFFTTPAGVTTVKVEAYGAGGSGAYGGGSNKNGGGGGGGGGYTVSTSVSVSAPTTYTLTVGTGGTANANTNSGNGSATSATFDSGLITASGGNGGRRYSSGGNGGNGGNGSNFDGGKGGTGTAAGSGGGGGAAGALSDGGTGSVTAGGTSGGGIAGSGATGSTSNTATGNSGNNFGGGGSGGTRNSYGGDGASGAMLITYTCPTYSLTSATALTAMCGSNPVTITLNSSAAGLPVGNYTVSITGTGATPGSTTVSMAVTTAGTGSFTTPALNIGTTTVTITNLTSSYCSNTISTNNTVTVTAFSNPTVNAGTTITTCNSGTPINITAGATTNGATVLWTSNGTGTFTNQNNISTCTYTPSAADLLAGNITLTLTASSPGCGSASSTKTLTFSSSPTAVAGGNITTCSSAGSLNIASGASATNYATVTWTSSGTGTFANPNTLSPSNYTPSAADIAAGSVTLTLTASNPGCTSAISTKTLTLIPAATAVAGTAVNACTLGGPVNITDGSGATNYSSIAWTASGLGTITNANSLTACTYTPTAADIAAGTVTLTLTAYGNSPCGNVTSTKTLTVRGPIVASAGTNVTICSSTGSVNIATGASSVNHTSITWTSSGTGTFATPNTLSPSSYSPSAADIAAGSVTITLTSSNGGCSNVVSNKTLTINSIATANSGSAVYTCAGVGAVNITTGSTAANYSSVLWSSTNGTGTFTNATSLTNCTYTPSNADITAGTRNITLTVYGNSPCGNVTSTKTINISRPMTAAAGTSSTICSTTTTVSIVAGASATNHTSTLWTTSGSGTFSNAASITSCTYTPSAADITAGSVLLTLTASNAGCPNAVSTKTLTINSLPISVAGPAMSTCTANGTINITAGSSAANQTSVTWTSTGSGTLSNANSLTACTYNPSAADITAGTVTFTLTAYGSAPCGNTTSTKTLSITVSPTVTGTTPGSRTGAGTVLLGATASLGTLNWYAGPTGGTALGTGTSFTTPVISSTTTFYVEAMNGSCPSSPRTPVVATVNYSEIDIQGNATSIVSGDTTPSTTDWTDFGSTNPTRTFTIRNVGTALLTVGAITISGANASDFTVTTLPSSAVGIGSSTTFVVTFAPTAVGIRTANISIVNNDLDENPYTFDITGTGVEQEIDLQGNSVSIVSGDTTPTTADWTDFSTVAGTRTFTIHNTGNIALNIGTITLSGANASDFTVTTPPSATVGPNSTTTFVVTFAPTAINNRTATISIANNDSNENPYTFAIQGYGVIPEIDIQGNSVSIPDSTLPAATTANWTDFSSTAGTRTFTIFNNGNIALTVGAISFTGTNASEFTVTTPPAASVPAFSSTTFTVTFMPTALGTRTAQIHIVNNDANENPYDFNLQGTGTPREIDVQGLGLSIASGSTITSITDGTDFGPADINLATVTRTFTIRNTGSLPLTIANPTITGANASEFSITANPSTLTVLAGSSTNFQVTFNPNAVFTRSASIRIVNNDSDENPYIFAIQGTGLLDNDGDGIENNTDEDDDNDGILDSIECGTCISNPFVNGSFETPVIGSSTYAILPTASVPGWETSAENFIEIWSSGFNGVTAAAGNQFAELNANIAGTLYQSFCLNGAGGTISWAIKHRGRGGVDQAFVKFGNTLANALSSTPIVTMVDGTTRWGSYSGTYTIPPGQTNIVLTFQAGYTGSGDASVGNFIDDVQIIINQNCVDSDGDGVADILDVDSDNDGIPDIEEAGFKQYSNNTATMDKTNPANWKDVNKNGINDYIDALVTAGTYFIPDTDGDGLYNHLDLDSDNDSLFDVDEAGLLNGDGDINGDGRGDGLDTEGDGLLNLYDNSTAFGSAFRPYALDSDLNGIPDYLQLDANDDGVNDIQTGLYGSYDANGDGRIDGSGDVDRDGITDTFDTNTTVKGSPRDLDRKLYLDFDGRNDYAEDSALLGGLANSSLMAWIDLNGTFSSTGVVVGQDKFQIRVSSAKTLQAIVNGTTLTYGTPLNTSQWYHVAATYGGGNLTLYLNGKSVATVALTGAIAADATKLTLGKNPLSAANYFKGKIDEVRVFNVTLTANQVERMVYQEIQNTASQVRGLIVPKDIGSLPFTNVLRYYRMDTYKDDIVDNLTTTTVDTGTGMKLYNHKVINYQQAPMPFTTLRPGTFSTAVNDPIKDIRGLDVLDYDYSIIQVKHNITETANSTDLALFIDPGVTVSMTNDTKLQNDWYLKLDGKIDLVGRSQLVQTTNSDLEATSAGSLERDQQGQSNRFNYNYWSSPVSTINTSTINNGYTVAGVMKDGTNPSSIQNLLWTTGINSSATSPLTLSSYWIFKFQNSSDAYANWATVGQNGALAAGQGYTLKGSNAATGNQNYTFVGKPNSGTITSTVGPTNLNLCGNPYPSAIDADKFIDDNATSLDGTLYFWEHYSTNTSHNTIEYQGGYGTYTKTGGTAPVAPAGASGLGSSSKIAKRFIPVGQGFFVTGSATGGTIRFNNAQRLFVKEDASSSYTLFRANNTTVSSSPEMNNAEDSFEEGQFMKVRLGYNSTNNYHRQILLGFMNENATAGFDNGYDGINIETMSNDMYFINGTNQLTISGEGFFNVNNTYPLGVRNSTSGNVTFVVDGKENFDDNQEIYIHDNVTNTYNSIKSGSYEINLPAGVYEDRFQLTFTNGTDLGTIDQEANHGIGVTHSQSNNMINIKNPLQEVTVKSVALFNLLGQKITEWKIDTQDQANIQLPVSNVSTGTYIVKVITDGGDVTKKILVKK